MGSGEKMEAGAPADMLARFTPEQRAAVVAWELMNTTEMLTTMAPTHLLYFTEGTRAVLLSAIEDAVQAAIARATPTTENPA